MAKTVDLQAVVKHIVDGSFGNNLCRICLQPLEGLSEDIFTKVCKEDKEYCIADVLRDVCQMKISSEDGFKVCSDCFFDASLAYKFFLLSKRSEEILQYYLNELQRHVDSIDVPDEYCSDSICIKLPLFIPKTELFDYSMKRLRLENIQQSQVQNSEVCNKPKKELKVEKQEVNDTKTLQLEPTDNVDFDEDIVIIMDENSKPTFFKTDDKGSLVQLSKEEANSYYEDLSLTSTSNQSVNNNESKKRRRKRGKMNYKSCSQCPIKYRFVAKLKEHMKKDHDIDIFICKVCKAIIEDEQEFNNHLRTHTNVHRCSICNAVFKKRETIIAHFRSHEAMKELSKCRTARVCEICGWILKDEESLLEHHEEKHVKKYTCYYCGRRYKGEASFELHIKKHESHLSSKQKHSILANKDTPKDKTKKRNYPCSTCAKSFFDERSLMWHERLHTDERPYVCEVCGRGFVSVNRRNQHALCAHTAPARRCPLCPALFHLRSMVNSHIKKVHLKTHKRRNRTSKHQNVFWRTEPVPFQELSVAVQTDILEMKTRQEAKKMCYGVQQNADLTEDDQFLEKYCTVNSASSGMGSPSL